jgi:hypothetical protein
MPALLTARDRRIHSLRLEIQRLQAWADVDKHDRRALAWHQAKISEAQAELAELEDK